MTGATTWNELISQPDAWQALLARLDRPVELPALTLADFDEVVMLGSGSSYYLALAAVDWVRRRHSIAARAVPSCEVILDQHEREAAPGVRRLAIAFSRSGESTELLWAVKAMQEAGSTVLGISCTAGSQLLEQADIVFHIREGHEDGLVMLRSFTSMLIAVQYLFGNAEDRARLRMLPQAARAVLENSDDDIQQLVNRRSFDRFVFLASSSSYPTALEASLKVQEMSLSTSEAYHTLEYRHGPKATADGRTLVTLFALPDASHGLVLANDLKALGVTLLVVGPGAEHYDGVADLTIPAADGLTEGAATAVTLLPSQLVAYHTALRRGQNPNAPTNLSKIVRLEGPA